MKAISLIMRILRASLVIDACRQKQPRTKEYTVGTDRPNILVMSRIEYTNACDRLTNFRQSHGKAPTECFGSPATNGLAPAAQLTVHWAECMPPPVQSNTQNSSQSNSMGTSDLVQCLSNL
eukprot:scaffold33057_cov38-Prasinocladus_malaysianus.AAC.2